MVNSFDWGEQVFPVSAPVLWKAVKIAIESSGQTLEGIDDYTMTASVKSKVSWTSWGESTVMQVTTRGADESYLRVESSCNSVTSKTEKNVIYFLTAVRDLLVQNGDQWSEEMGLNRGSEPRDSGESIEDRLLKLKGLLAKGLIDADEFESKKEEILRDL